MVGISCACSVLFFKWTLQWFSPQVVTDGFFRVSKNTLQEGSLKLTGKLPAQFLSVGLDLPSAPNKSKLFFVVPVNSSRRLIVVGCGSGIYVGPVHSERKHALIVCFLAILANIIKSRILLCIEPQKSFISGCSDHLGIQGF
jgi:hypothetical protein